MNKSKEPNSKLSKLEDTSSIKAKIFTLLDENPLLSAKHLSRITGLDYRYYRNYLYNLKHKWKANSKNELGSKCSSVHGWRGWTYFPSGLEKECQDALRLKAICLGWIPSSSRNRFLLWRDPLGRLQWFETGRVNLYVRKSANYGRACQLLANGFFNTQLLSDIKFLEGMTKGIRFKGAHYTFRTGERLPPLTIDLFQKSNGVTIKIGDRSHPSSVEVITSYPDWAERNEHLLSDIRSFLRETFFIDRDVLSKDRTDVFRT